jgi:hypothetical protein
MPRLTLILLAATLLLSPELKPMEAQTNNQAAALKQAHDAGILTDAEYQQKLQALQHGAGTPPRPRAASTATSGKGNTWHMKRAVFRQNTALEAMPQWGLPGRKGGDVDAMAMLIPVDWTFQAAGAPLPFDCNLTAGRILALAISPDKQAGVAIVPGKASLWSNDRDLLQSVEQNNRQFQHNTHCEVEQPQPLAQKIVAIAKGLNKDAQITGPMQPVPGLSDKLPGMLEEANRNLAQQGTHVEATAGRIPTRGDDGGVPTAGFFSVLQVVKTQRLPNGNVLVTTDYPMQIGTFAPEGKYAAMEPMFNAMLDSVMIDPEYAGQCAQTSANLISMHQQTLQRLQRIQNEIAADNINAARQRQQLIMGEQRYSNDMHNHAFQERTAALDHSAQQFSLYLSGDAVYKDPGTGARVQMSNQYDHAWSSGNGEYILTDSASYNPNGHVGSSNWTQLEKEK